MGADFEKIRPAPMVLGPSRDPKRPNFRVAQMGKLSPNCRQGSRHVMILGHGEVMSTLKYRNNLNLNPLSSTFAIWWIKSYFWVPLPYQISHIMY